MKRFLALVMILTMLISAIPAAQLSAFAEATEADYEIRSLEQFDNGWHPTDGFILRWYNPSVKPDKVSVYAIGSDGAETLLDDSLNTDAGAKVLYRVKTSGAASGVVYTYKIVCTFADGKVTEQYTSAKFTSLSIEQWYIAETFAGIWATDRKRFEGSYEAFPGKAEVVYKDGNSSLKITSADTTVSSDSDFWFRKISVCIPCTNLEVGKNYTLSFKYKQKNCEWIVPKCAGEGGDIIWGGLSLGAGASEDWQEKEYEFTYNSAAKGENFAFWVYSENEEFLLDDVKIVETGKNDNLINDGDFENITSSMADVEGAYCITNNGKTTVGWTNAGDAEYVDVYKVLKGSELRVARLDANKGSAEFAESSAEYILRTVKGSVGSRGVKAEVKLPTYTPSDYAAKSAVLYDNGWNWNSRFKATWFNPAAPLEKTELFLVGTDGTETLAESSFDLTANKGVCCRINTANPAAYPTGGNGVYTYKIKFTFKDGTVTEQYITNQIKDYSNDAAKVAVWNEIVHIDDEWQFWRSRNGESSLQTFPGKVEKVKIDGNGVLRATSNTAYQDGALNFDHSMSLYIPFKSLTAGKTYRVSFRYKAENSAYIFFKTPTAWENLAAKTGWQTMENTFVYDGADSLRFRFFGKNRELLIDDFVLTEEGSSVNLVSDPSFDNAETALKEVLKASYRTENGRDVLTWKEPAGIDYIDVFKEADGEKIYMGRINKNVRTVSFVTDPAAQKYIIKTVKGVSVSAGEDVLYSESPYASESTDEFAAKYLTAVNAGKTGEMYIIWKNADNSNIQSVYIADENGNKVADGFSTEPNAVVRYEMKNLKDPTMYYTYKLVTVTKDGGEIEQPVSGMWYTAAEGHTYTSGGVSIQRRYQVPQNGENDPDPADDSSARLSPIFFEISGDEHTDGEKSLMVFNALHGWWKEEGVEISFIPDEPLKKDNEYTISFMQKGSRHASQKIFWGGEPQDLADGGTSAYNKEWTEHSRTYTLGADTSSVRLLFLTKGYGECYIDDVKITAADGTVVYSESFENMGTNTAVIDNLTAEPSDGAVKLAWTAPGLDDEIPKVTRIYAEAYGNKYLVGTLDPNAADYTVKGLDNGTEYKFIAETVTEDGIVSEPREVSATPAAGKYSVSKIMLTDENGTAISQSTLTAGSYKAQAIVKNNEMGGKFNAEVVVCLYDGNTLYSAASSGTSNIPQSDWRLSGEKLVTDTITVPETEGHDFSIRVYVWSSLKSMQPLAEMKTFFN